MAALPPVEFARTVRAHWRDTLGIILAASPATKAFQRRSLATIARRLEGVGPTSLPEAEDLPTSWLLGVLLARGDTAEAVAEWATGLPPDGPQRIRFYVLPRTDLARAIEPWVAAGLPPRPTASIRTWSDFHKQFGADLNLQVYRDHRP